MIRKVCNILDCIFLTDFIFLCNFMPLRIYLLQNLINMTNELSVDTNKNVIQNFKLFYEGDGAVVNKLNSKIYGNITSYNKTFDVSILSSPAYSAYYHLL